MESESWKKKENVREYFVKGTIVKRKIEVRSGRTAERGRGKKISL